MRTGIYGCGWFRTATANLEMCLCKCSLISCVSNFTKWVLIDMCLIFISYSKVPPSLPSVPIWWWALPSCFPCYVPPRNILYNTQLLQTDNLTWTVALRQWILFMYCRGLWPALCFDLYKIILLWISCTVNFFSSFDKLIKTVPSLFSSFLTF